MTNFATFAKCTWTIRILSGPGEMPHSPRPTPNQVSVSHLCSDSTEPTEWRLEQVLCGAPEENSVLLEETTH